MKRLIFALALIFAVSSVFAADGDRLAEKLFAPETVPLMLTDFGLNGAGKPFFQAQDKPESEPEPEPETSQLSTRSSRYSDVNPGKALLLSAIVPGAGQFYARQWVSGGIFLFIELAAWGSVYYFYNESMDKQDEFEKFARKHFKEDDYRKEEYDLATDGRYGDTLDVGNIYDGTSEQWTALDWNIKSKFLPNFGFTHELPTHDGEYNFDNESLEQQFYEMIGKYIHQFGFGWNDGYGDTDEFPHFEGASPNSKKYMGMRHDHNVLWDYSDWGLKVALLNHVASALHVSFTVKAGRREAKTDLSFRQIPYDRELINAAGLNITW